jgi:hypothetical protein
MEPSVSDPWRQLLASEDPKDRLEGIKLIAALAESSREVVLSLEHAVLKDANEAVRQAAEKALLAFPHQPLYRSLMGTTEAGREYMLYEIGRLEKEGLFDPHLASLIKARYALKPAADPEVHKPSPVSPAAPETLSKPGLEPTPAAQKQPAPSLTQILLSETTIKITLYLGAFFVVAAAFILAALVEVSRLPVLGTITVVFLGVSLGLSRRLPLASFVLFDVALLMIPIDGQVLLPLLHLNDPNAVLMFWSGTWLLTTLAAGGGLVFYRSRLMSLAAFGAGLFSLYFLGQGLNFDPEINLFLPAVWGLINLGLAYLLSVRLGSRFFWPLFAATQLCLAVVLAVSFFNWVSPLGSILFDAQQSGLSGYLNPQIGWGWAAVLWLSASIYYFLSDFLTRRLGRPMTWFVFPAVLALQPVPALFLSQLKPEFNILIYTLWGWGIIQAGAGEGLRRIKHAMAGGYARALLGGFVFFSILTPLCFLTHDNWQAISICLAGTALAALVLSWLQLRWYWVGMAITFGAAAYFAAFNIPQNVSLRDSLLQGEIILLPALALLGLDWAARKRQWSRQIWIPALVFGAGLYVIAFFSTLFYPAFPSDKILFSERRLLALMIVHAVFLGFYARSYRRPFNAVPWSMALFNAFLAVFFFLNIPEIQALSLLLFAVAAVPTLAFLSLEWYFRQRQAPPSWRVPALAMGVLAGLLNTVYLADYPPQQTWLVVVVLVIFALFWGFEARSLKTLFWIPWLLSLISAYAAYLLFWTIPAVKTLNLDPLFVRLPPALVFLALEWFLRQRGRPAAWRTSPLIMGVTAVIINLSLFVSLADGEIWMLAVVLTLYALFFILDAIWLKRLSTIPWSISLAFLYAAYLLFWQIPEIKIRAANSIITLLPPVFIFLTVEWILHRRGKGPGWHRPALAAGFLAMGIHVIGMVRASSGDSHLVAAACVLYALFLGAYAIIEYSLTQSDTKGLEIFQRRIYWALALVFASTAYWRLFDLTGWPLHWNDSLKLFPLAVILLSLNLGLKNRKFEADWWLPALVMGGAGWMVDVFLTLKQGLELDPGINPALLFLGWGSFFILYMIIDNQPWIGYLSTASLSLALLMGLRFQQSKEWVLAFSILAAVFYLAGFFMIQRLKRIQWGWVFSLSGLVLAGLAALSAPIEYQPSGAAGVALAAVLYTLEGFRRKNVWWGFPACGLYFLAYSLALLQLKITEPQYYSIGAALLGIIMHYLLIRTSNAWAALITGILAQLILFGTSYIQMVQSLDLKFFTMLFFQSLVLLVYGLVVRSRTLVLVPIGFVILGVVTVTLTILKGLPTALIIGCTGMLLLILGIAGLLLRERLVRWVENFKLHLENW